MWGGQRREAFKDFTIHTKGWDQFTVDSAGSFVVCETLEGIKKKNKKKNKYWLHKKILAAFNHLRTKWLTSAEQARKVGTMLIGHCLKGQFKPKSMIHVFPLACSAIYHAIKNVCILSDIKLSFSRIHDSVTRDNPQTVAVSTFMFDF